MDSKLNKTTIIRDRLLNGGSITSLEAINICGATRLSAIIYNLRKRGMIIESVQIKHIDMFGHECFYSKYFMPHYQKR